LTSLSLSVVSSSTLSGNANGAAGGAQALAIGQQLMTQLRQLKPVGRLVIDVNRVMKGRPGVSDDVLVRDGDKLLIPKQTQEILILGEVQSPTSHVFEAGLTRDDYLAKSGGITQKADRKGIYVVRANGNVVSGERRGWFRAFAVRSRCVPAIRSSCRLIPNASRGAASVAGCHHDPLQLVGGNFCDITFLRVSFINTGKLSGVAYYLSRRLA